MADDNQELSMEDILSSIKDILTEDEAAQNGAPVQSPFAPVQPVRDTPQSSPAAEEAAAPIAAQPQISEPEEDVLDLSPAMRIENEDGINLDDELGGISSGFEEINLDPQPADEEPAAEPLFSASDLGAAASFDESADLDSDPFYETETPVSGFEVASSEEPFEISDIIADEEAFAPQAQSQTEPEPEFVSEPEPELVSEPEPQFAEPELPAEETSADKLEVKSDAVDVSASIISNFAKMFTKEKEPEPAEPESKVAAFAGERVHLLGAGSKTIEDVVSNVIRQIIGDEVSENWRRGCDYDTYAREVIAAQTKQWLETNLPAVVERIVKEEIARVMEKAGS